MAKALIGLKIATGICDLIEEARECIWLMSPYMKLHKDYQAALSTLRAKPSVKLRILIGGKSYQSLNHSIWKSLMKNSYFHCPMSKSGDCLNFTLNTMPMKSPA
jgi:hypothetical protein